MRQLLFLVKSPHIFMLIVCEQRKLRSMMQNICTLAHLIFGQLHGKTEYRPQDYKTFFACSTQLSLKF